MPMTGITDEGPRAALGLGPTGLPTMCSAADAQANWAQRRHLLLLRAPIPIPLGGLAKLARERQLLEPPDPFAEITPAMRALRNTERPSARRDAYLNGRVDDQRAWYAHRARHDAAVADRWDVGFFLLTGLAVVAGVLLAANPDL